MDDLIAILRQNDWLSAEQWAALETDAATPREPRAFLDLLRDRQILTAEQVASLTNPVIVDEPTLLSDEPMPLITVPLGHEDRPFIPESIEVEPEPFVPPLSSSNGTAPVRRQTEKPMTRETMWTWIGLGGGFWLIGLIVLGLWLGGCFQDAPKVRPKAKMSETKNR